MQQRRFRPGDVLDDYCPRERRITDHAIVAMIDDHIKQTRCVVCDAEHEYKGGKVPPQRRKKPQTALFTQVLDGLQGPQPARVPVPTEVEPESTDEILDAPPPPVLTVPTPEAAAVLQVSQNLHEPETFAAVSDNVVAPPSSLNQDDEPAPGKEEGLWRRPLIRAALPRPEGQPPPQTRPAPDFTVRQPTNNRPHRHGRRRGAGDQQGQGGGGNYGPMRFGRGAQGQGGKGHGQGQGHGAGRARRRRGGKKNH
jgi:hypothetical protein